MEYGVCFVEAVTTRVRVKAENVQEAQEKALELAMTKEPNWNDVHQDSNGCL